MDFIYWFNESNDEYLYIVGSQIEYSYKYRLEFHFSKAVYTGQYYGRIRHLLPPSKTSTFEKTGEISYWSKTLLAWTWGKYSFNSCFLSPFKALQKNYANNNFLAFRAHQSNDTTIMRTRTHRTLGKNRENHHGTKPTKALKCKTSYKS